MTENPSVKELLFQITIKMHLCYYLGRALQENSIIVTCVSCHPGKQTQGSKGKFTGLLLMGKVVWSREQYLRKLNL